MSNNNALLLSLLGNYLSFKVPGKGKNKIDFVSYSSDKIGSTYVKYYATELSDLLDNATLEGYNAMLPLLANSYTFKGVDSFSSAYAIIAIWYDKDEKLEVTCSISKDLDALSPIVVSDENGQKFRSFFFSTKEKLEAMVNAKKTLAPNAVTEALRVLDLKLNSEYNEAVNDNAKKEYKKAV